MNKEYAPIIIFAFNRPSFLMDLITSLKQCEESEKSDLYVFVDGPRNQIDVELVCATQTVAAGIHGFNSVEYRFSEKNKGLGNSIISGVSEVLNKYGRAIVLEDDLILTPNYLTYMNAALDYYANIPSVFSVCGCSLKVKKPMKYPYDVYFETRNNSTGWGIWVDRWNTIDWKLEDWESCVKNKRLFCRWAGSDSFLMLKNWKIGKNKSWAIRLGYSQFLQQRLSVFPFASKIDNQGFDGSGTNSRRYNRFKYEIDQTASKVFKFSPHVAVDKKIHKQIMHYHSIPLRIWSRLMYLIYR